MKKYDNYKIKIEDILKGESGKITLTKKIVKRNSYVFSVGEPQYLQSSIIFENDIEEELGMSAGTSSKPFIALREVSDDNFIIPSVFEGKIRKIYEWN